MLSTTIEQKDLVFYCGKILEGELLCDGTCPGRALSRGSASARFDGPPISGSLYVSQIAYQLQRHGMEVRVKKLMH